MIAIRGRMLDLALSQRAFLPMLNSETRHQKPAAFAALPPCDDRRAIDPTAIPLKTLNESRSIVVSRIYSATHFILD